MAIKNVVKETTFLFLCYTYLASLNAMFIFLLVAT